MLGGGFLGNFCEKMERERRGSCFGAVDGFETSCKLLSQALGCLKLGSSPRRWVKPRSWTRLKGLSGLERPF